MTNYYFKHEDSEVCYNKKYFDYYMKENEITEIEVYKAVKEKIDGIFWCRKYLFAGDGTQNYCGKQCRDYSPRNGKSGRCRYHSTDLYYPDGKITLKLSEKK